MRQKFTIIICSL